MENTRERPGEWDALPKLREGEPYFGLIGRDRFAPDLIMDWAQKNRDRAHADYEAGTITQEQLEDELRKSTNAEMIAADMKAYKNGWATETKSEAKQSRPSYTGHQLPRKTQLRDLELMTRTRAASAIHGSIYELNEAAKQLDDVANTSPDTGLLSGVRSDLHEVVERLAAIAARVAPRRPVLDR